MGWQANLSEVLFNICQSEAPALLEPPCNGQLLAKVKAGNKCAGKAQSLSPSRWQPSLQRCPWTLQMRILFANWLRLAMALIGYLKTFKLRQVSPKIKCAGKAKHILPSWWLVFAANYTPSAQYTFRNVLFANWLQLAMALKGNLKTFELARRKTNDVPMERFSAGKM